MLEELKKEVYEANMLLPKYGLVTFTWGNVSGIDRESGLFVIKPSGVEYDQLTPEDMVVMDLDGNKIEVIYNGLKEKSISWNKSIRLRRKRQLLFGDNERVILFVGRLDDIKGVEYLIRAFRLLLEKIPESRLVIVGEGKYDTFLKECVHIWHRVTFTGKLDQKTLQRFYQIADVGVMPSFHEQCSYVAIEMMMYGIPLIGTDSTGLKEMLGDNQKYMMKIFEEANNVSLSVENLAHTLVQLLTESFPRKAGKNGRLIFEHKFSLSVMKDKMLAFYGRL